MLIVLFSISHAFFRYSTSKCHTVADLEDLRYFGYRGEALASIKDACAILEIVTRTKSSSKPLCKLFQNGKALPIKESAIPRPSVGTTITVHGLFMNFPVRQKGVIEGLELEKIRQRVAGLALMKPHVSIRLRNDATGNTLIHTAKCSNSLITFSSLFGQVKAQTLVEIQGLKGKYTVDGYIGREGSTKKDVQFVYINGRLVLKTEIHKLINQLMKKSAICKKKVSFSSVSPELDSDVDVTRKSPGKQLDKHPMFIINVKCPLKEYDITFDPSKTLVEFNDWHTLLHLVTEITTDFLKKEKLTINAADQEYSNAIEPKESTSCVQGALEISPCNVKDALVSKAAKRFGKKEEIIVKTPEGITLENWKSENKSVDRLNNSASNTERNDAVRDDTLEKYCATCSDVEKGRSTWKFDRDCDICSNCDIVHSSNEDFETKKFSECKNMISVHRNQMEREKRIQSHNCYIHSAFNGNFEKGVIERAPVESTRKFQASPRSALSMFRRYVGKPYGNMPFGMPSNINDKLKRISNVLASDKSMEEKSVSSLQRFRKFAFNHFQKCERSVSDNQNESLPAKFKKINDVPKVTTQSLQEELINIQDVANSKTISEKLPDSDPTDQPNKISNDYTSVVVKLNVQTPTPGSHRKRANEIVNEIVNEKSSKQKKINGNKTETSGPTASNENSSFKSVYDNTSVDMTKGFCVSDGCHKFNDFSHKVSNAFEAVKTDTSKRLNDDIQSVLGSENKSFAMENGNLITHFDGSYNVNTYMKGSVDKMVADMYESPEVIAGSHLFKNLPDIDTTSFKDSDSPEMFTAAPVDTNKVIQSIITAGINLHSRRISPALTQEFIQSTSSDEAERSTEIYVHSDTMKEFTNEKNGETFQSQLMNTTQEFTPVLMDEDKKTETSELSEGFIVEQISSDKDLNIVSDVISPNSTGFTPMMEDDSSPITDTTTGTDGKETPEVIMGLNNRNNMQTNEMETSLHEYDHQMQISQDTLEMSSIWNSSRLDESGFELKITKSSEMPKDGKTKDETEVEDSHPEISSDDITVTQLLGVKNHVSSDETCHGSKDVLTFRDIFTPSQSQIDGNLFNREVQTSSHQFAQTLKNMVTGLLNSSLENILCETFDEESEEHIHCAQPTAFSKVRAEQQNRQSEIMDQEINIQQNMQVIPARVNNVKEEINKDRGDGEIQTGLEVSIDKIGRFYFSNY